MLLFLFVFNVISHTFETHLKGQIPLGKMLHSVSYYTCKCVHTNANSSGRDMRAFCAENSLTHWRGGWWFCALVCISVYTVMFAKYIRKCAQICAALCVQCVCVCLWKCVAGQECPCMAHPFDGGNTCSSIYIIDANIFVHLFCLCAPVRVWCDHGIQRECLSIQTIVRTHA